MHFRHHYSLLCAGDLFRYSWRVTAFKSRRSGERDLRYQLLHGVPSSETRFEPLCTSTIPGADCFGERGASSFSTCQVSFDPVKGSVGILPR